MLHQRLDPFRSPLGKILVIALGVACSQALASTPALHAAQPADLQPLNDKLPGLPLTATFEKVSSTEDAPPFVLKLKNESKASLKVSAKIILSVVVHNAPNSRNLPDHVIAAGQTWTIPALAALDKVVLTAEGFTPLELTVH